jgi:glutathione synthase/RimK-type ligase-like ATP-grasp enzyme
MVDDRGNYYNLAETGTVWWRQPEVPEPAVDDSEVVREFVRGEWGNFLGGLEMATSCRWVNPPTAYHRARYRIVQLAAAKDEGLRIPETIITNNPDEVRAMHESHPRMIYKVLGGARRCSPHVTQPLDKEDLERLSGLALCPAIFQERIDARCDIRVTMIGLSIHAAEIDSQAGSSPLDWRLDHTVCFKPHDLDSLVGDKLRGLMTRLGLTYGAIDLRLTSGGEYVFLEVNPGGQYLFVELLAGLPLTDAMADFLAGDSP